MRESLWGLALSCFDYRILSATYEKCKPTVVLLMEFSRCSCWCQDAMMLTILHVDLTNVDDIDMFLSTWQHCWRLSGVVLNLAVFYSQQNIKNSFAFSALTLCLAL